MLLRSQKIGLPDGIQQRSEEILLQRENELIPDFESQG